MNITVRTYGDGVFVCRPDTTWERENKDFYSPDTVSDILYSPVVFARISKAGKSVSRKFAHRYYDGMNFGMLLYPGEIYRRKEAWSLAAASILDHTSYLPSPLYLPEVFRTAGNIFELEKDGRTVFSTATDDDGTALNAIETALAEASAYVSLRIGDLVAVELAEASVLSGPDEKKTGISAHFCNNELFRFYIIK